MITASLYMFQMQPLAVLQFRKLSPALRCAVYLTELDSTSWSLETKELDQYLNVQRPLILFITYP